METKDLLKNRREELELTQKEVADYVGVSEATISRWESGEIKNLKRNRIASLAKVLNLPPSLIVGDIDSELIELEKNTSSVATTEGMKRYEKYAKLDLDEIVLGGGNVVVCSQEEEEILNLYRKADPHDKETVRQVLSRYMEDNTLEGINR